MRLETTPLVQNSIMPNAELGRMVDQAEDRGYDPKNLGSSNLTIQSRAVGSMLNLFDAEEVVADATSELNRQKRISSPLAAVTLGLLPGIVTGMAVAGARGARWGVAAGLGATLGVAALSFAMTRDNVPKAQTELDSANAELSSATTRATSALGKLD